ncbi:RNase P subunit p30 family protein [Methanothrix sp.]|uniref:RNase P subunit p30 family protein n=1 Tax=Methanothrix sp. TaxID=90426 RepID=UPI0034E205F5
MYYEPRVHVMPQGSSSPSRMALVARRLGFSGIIVMSINGSGDLQGLDAAQRIGGISVASGVEVASKDPKGLKGRIASLRDRYPFLAVHATSESVLREALDDPRVDLVVNSGFRLTVPEARSAKRNQVALAIDLQPMIRLRGASRLRWLDLQRYNVRVARKFNISIMITASPRSHLDLRSPRDMMAMAQILGISRQEALEALRLPGRVLDMNQRRWASPGVEVLETHSHEERGSD